MDLSKLPRMSETPPPPPPEPEPQPAPPSYASDAPGAGGGFAEAWISIAIGVILLFVSTAGRLIEYLTSSNFSWTFTDETGAPLPYRQSVYFWGDVAIFAFAVVLITEGLLLFTRRVALIWAAFAFTIMAVALNLFYVAGMMSKGYGFQLWSGLAVAFGVYIAIHQWRLIALMKMLRTGR